MTNALAIQATAKGTTTTTVAKEGFEAFPITTQQMILLVTPNSCRPVSALQFEWHPCFIATTNDRPEAFSLFFCGPQPLDEKSLTQGADGDDAVDDLMRMQLMVALNDRLVGQGHQQAYTFGPLPNYLRL